MNKFLGLCIAALTTSVAWSEETGRVLSSTPVLQQVGVPRRVCSEEQTLVQPAKSGAGAAMGAVAGGAVGNAFGSGGGRALATFIGLIGGALLGERIEGTPAPQAQHVQNCSMQSFLENRVVGYNVRYEYAGKHYSVQLPSDPGPTIRLQVAPVGALAPAQISYGTPAAYAAPVQAPARVYQQMPVARPAPVDIAADRVNLPRRGGEDFSGY